MRGIYQPFVIFMGIGLLLTCALTAPTAAGQRNVVAPSVATAARVYQPNSGPLTAAVQNVAIHDADQRKDRPLRVDHVAYVRSTSLAFWDAYLKENDAAKQFLRSDQLRSATAGNATVERK